MIFFGGLFMVVVSFVVFIMFADPVNDRRVWLEDACAGVMMLGFGVVIIGAVVWIGQVLR
jgi:predicted RNA methylase